MVLLIGLGTWQLHRGMQKRALLDALSAPDSSGVLEISGTTRAPAGTDAPRARASGTYEAKRSLLLDNQSRERVPGYHVWTPLKLADGTWLIVNRGWVAQNPDRRVLPDIPAPAVATVIEGHWRPLPRPGLRLGAESCTGTAWPRVVQYPTAKELSCLLGAPVADGILLLDGAPQDGLIREWTLPPALPPERHFAYAAQWYAFAATLLALFVKLNLKRLP